MKHMINKDLSSIVLNSINNSMCTCSLCVVRGTVRYMYWYVMQGKTNMNLLFDFLFY